jgi:TetR/AcrR family transcriptional repressor of nem operon
MSDKLTKSERTKNFIIESMAEMFNKRGYAGTTMADVEMITGLSRGGIYGNFENKELMALAAFDYNLGKLCDAIRIQMVKAGSFHDKLMVYARVYKTLSEDDVLGGSPILNTATEADDTNHLLKERVADASKKWHDCMAGFIVEGIETGEFRKDANVDQIAFSILSMIEGGLILSRITNDSSRMDQIMNTVEMMINNIHNN